MPDAAVDAVKAVLRGQVLTPAGGPGEAVEIVASLPHGHVAAVVTAARRLGFPELLGPPGRLRDLAFALLVARGFGWVTALRAPDVAALAAADGPLQFSLFDQANLAEITHPDYPDERLVACRAFTAAVDVVRDKFGLTDLVLVGDRGMITSARIAALRELGGFRGLLDHLATLTRNTLRFPALPDAPTVEQLAVPTPTQRRAFQLLDTAVPLRLT